MGVERILHPSFPKEAAEPYLELDLRGYWVFLGYLNQKYIEDTRELLASSPLGPDQCLVLLGSDGKRERHAQSKTDIAIVQRSSPGNLSSQGFMDSFDRTHIKNFTEVFDLQLFEEPEVKTVGDPTLMVSDAYPYVFAGEKRRIYPDRMLNTVYLLGNQDVYTEARRQVLREMTDNDKRSGVIRRELVKQLKSYRKCMETGLYRDRPTFTQDPPFQYYDEDPEIYSTGFKIGFLRTMQRFLDIAVVVGIQQGFFSIDEAVVNLPTTSPDRITYLCGKGLFNGAKRCEGAVDSYLWFLQQYHFAQELYKRTRHKVKLEFDAGEFQTQMTVMEEFTRKGYLSPKRNFLSQ